jgi:hypothetical protein
VNEHSLRKANLARYLSNDSGTHSALVRALSRLPDDALEFVVDKCAFFSIGGGSNGQCLPSRFTGEAEWLILIDNDAPDLETVIAHEVAHAYLGHGLEDATKEETEKQAREQVRAWGFTGKGADF